MACASAWAFSGRDHPQGKRVRGHQNPPQLSRLGSAALSLTLRLRGGTGILVARPLRG
jgi:hypothetical protein